MSWGYLHEHLMSPEMKLFSRGHTVEATLKEGYTVETTRNEIITVC